MAASKNNEDCSEKAVTSTTGKAQQLANLKPFKKGQSGNPSLSRSEVGTLAKAYLGELTRIDAASKRIINKTPLNFLKIGLIRLLLPGARIIHCRRDPLDTCVSIYFQNFAPQQRFATDLCALGAYYAGYQEMMRHWDELLGDALFTVNYETLLREPERVLRDCLGYLDLPWDAACLDFQVNRRRVDTPSLHQVRQPLYDRSVGRWRHYEQHLAPLREALEAGPR